MDSENLDLKQPVFYPWELNHRLLRSTLTRMKTQLSIGDKIITPPARFTSKTQVWSLGEVCVKPVKTISLIAVTGRRDMVHCLNATEHSGKQDR